MEYFNERGGASIFIFEIITQSVQDLAKGAKTRDYKHEKTFPPLSRSLVGGVGDWFTFNM